VCSVFEQTTFDLFAVLCVLFLTDDPVLQIGFELGKLIAIDAMFACFVRRPTSTSDSFERCSAGGNTNARAITINSAQMTQKRITSSPFREEKRAFFCATMLVGAQRFSGIKSRRCLM
jgi:hypothetical protein